MHAAVYGKGAPVLLLHEWLGDHRNWQPMFQHFRSDWFEFHCLDLPGYRLSRALSAKPDINFLADAVLNYADQHGLRKFSLVVHSMSGLIGHRLGQVAAHRLRSLVFVCPVPPAGFKASETDHEAMRLITIDRAALRKAILARGGRLETTEWLSNKQEMAWTSSSPQTKQMYLQMFLAPAFPKPQKSQFENMSILCGEADLPFYKKNSLESEFAPFYSTVRVTQLSECGHYPMLQKPKKFANVLQELLS